MRDIYPPSVGGRMHLDKDFLLEPTRLGIASDLNRHLSLEFEINTIRDVDSESIFL